MIDIRKLKENPEAAKAGFKAKEVDCDAIVDRILDLDVQVRALFFVLLLCIHTKPQY